MTSQQQVHKQFESQLAALELVVLNVRASISLLRRSVEGKLSLKNKDDRLMRVVLTHYIVNNLAALFDKKNNSLPKIAIQFKKDFPKDFFSGYSRTVNEFIKTHDADLKRIRKNRNLSTAHLGDGKNGKLGWSSQVAKNIDRVLGTQSSVATDGAHRFITPFQIFDMPIMDNIQKLKDALEELSIKFITETKSGRNS